MRKRFGSNGIRRGSFLVEVIVSLVIMASALAAVTQITILAARQRRAVQHRQLAILEAANLMERIAALSWSDTAPARTEAMKLSAVARQTLHQPRLRIDVDEIAGLPPAKRLTVEITWQNSIARPVEPVRLVAWKYGPSPGGTP